MPEPITIRIDDLSDPRIAAFMNEHLADMRRVTPPESVHALDLDALRKPDITFWTAWDGDTLVGTGALKQLDAGHGELKSMRTTTGRRRRGIATLILDVVVSEARRRGYRRLSLETGSFPFFEPARALYRRHGFVPCGPFADYWNDPNSFFMTRALSKGSDTMHIVSCTLERHGAAILDIYNDTIAHSTAVYEYHPFDAQYIEKWFAAKRDGQYPVIGAEDDDGTLMGFASYGVFRARPGYKYSVEHSVYVQKDHRGKGVGDRLLREIIARAQAQDYHVMVGGIDAENLTSIRLHEKHGFVHAGTVRESGYKFGRWLDVAFYQLILPTPARPVES